MKRSNDLLIWILLAVIVLSGAPGAMAQTSGNPTFSSITLSSPLPGTSVTFTPPGELPVTLQARGLAQVFASADYEASGSLQTTTGSISAGSTGLALASALDFANGQGVLIAGAGAAFAAAQPTVTATVVGSAPLIAATGSWTTGSTTIALAACPSYVAGGESAYDATTAQSIGTVASCAGGTLTLAAGAASASSGSTDNLQFLSNYVYSVASVDSAGGIGVPTTATASGAPAFQAAASNVSIAITPGAGAAAYVIWKQTNGGAWAYLGSGQASAYIDTGFPAPVTPWWIPATPPASAQNDWCVRSIASGAGTANLTLSSACPNAASGATVHHDDTAALNAALAQSAGALVWLPCGGYRVSSSISFPFASVGLYGYGVCTEIWASGASDIFSTIGTISSQPKGQFVDNMQIDGTGMVAGRTLYCLWCGRFDASNLIVNRPYSGFAFVNFNDVRMAHIRIARWFGQQGIMLALQSDAANVSNVFDGTDFYGNGNGGPHGDYANQQMAFYVDGNVATVITRNFGYSDPSGKGVRVSNDVGNATVPSFQQWHHFGGEFSTGQGIDLEAGVNIEISDSYLHAAGYDNFVSCAASSDFYVGPNVSLWQFTGGGIANASGDNAYIAGIEGQFSPGHVIWGSGNQGGTPGQCPGVELASTAFADHVSNATIGDTLHPTWQGPAVELDSGASANIVALNTFAGNAQNTVVDNSEQSSNVIGLNAGDTAPGWAWDNVHGALGLGLAAASPYFNNGNEPGLVARFNNGSGDVRETITNGGTGGSASMQFSETSVGNLYAFNSLKSASTRRMEYSLGSGATGGETFDATNGGALDAPLTLKGGATAGAPVVNGFGKLMTTTVAALPACTSTLKGQLYEVMDANAPAWNAPLSGSGATLALAFCNGSSWTAH